MKNGFFILFIILVYVNGAHSEKVVLEQMPEARFDKFFSPESLKSYERELIASENSLKKSSKYISDIASVNQLLAEAEKHRKDRNFGLADEATEKAKVHAKDVRTFLDAWTAYNAKFDQVINKINKAQVLTDARCKLVGPEGKPDDSCFIARQINNSAESRRSKLESEFKSRAEAINVASVNALLARAPAKASAAKSSTK